jgi:hypothetical protein
MVWLLELMVFFAEKAVQSIHECGDIFEDIGDYLTDMYDKIIQRLNKEQTPDLYFKYKARLKTIIELSSKHI